MNAAGRGEGLTLLHHVSETGGTQPFPTRQDTMFLDGVRPKDVPRGRLAAPKEDTQALRTHDINGAQANYPHKAFHADGPPEKEFIPGSKAATRYPELNRAIDLSLTTCDIHRAQPDAGVLKTGRRVDPLVPRYELPSYTERPPTPLDGRVHEGSWRETMEFKGTHTPRILERNYARDPNDIRDIEHSLPSSRTRTGGFTPRDPLKTIEKAGGRILSSKCHTARQSDPLEPRYDLCQRSHHPYAREEADSVGSAHAPRQVGPIEGAAARPRQWDNGEPQTSLIRRDIPGAVPQRFKGTLPFSIYDSHGVTPCHARHSGLDCSDIEGTKTGTRTQGAWKAIGT